MVARLVLGSPDSRGCHFGGAAASLLPIQLSTRKLVPYILQQRKVFLPGCPATAQVYLEASFLTSHCKGLSAAEGGGWNWREVSVEVLRQWG